MVTKAHRIAGHWYWEARMHLGFWCIGFGIDTVKSIECRRQEWHIFVHCLCFSLSVFQDRDLLYTCKSVNEFMNDFINWMMGRDAKDR